MLPKRDWTDMTWADIAGADTRRWIVVLPLAATEQHGVHLPLGVDGFIADAYLQRVRDLAPLDLPVTFLPVQRIGPSSEHLGFPGTVSISAETAIRTWTEVGESVFRAGVRKLVMVTSHGGNVAPMEIVARDLRVRLRMLVVTAAWHRFGYPDNLFSAEEREHGIHAGEIETSIVLACRPSAARMEKAARNESATVAMKKEFTWLNAHGVARFGWMTQDLHASGAVGDATSATAERGEAALTYGAQAFIELLREIDRFDLARLRDGPEK